eukprot:962191-Rhodomonas_salina.1
MGEQGGREVAGRRGEGRDDAHPIKAKAWAVLGQGGRCQARARTRRGGGAWEGRRRRRQGRGGLRRVMLRRRRKENSSGKEAAGACIASSWSRASRRCCTTHSDLPVSPPTPCFLSHSHSKPRNPQLRLSTEVYFQVTEVVVYLQLKRWV